MSKNLSLLVNVLNITNVRIFGDISRYAEVLAQAIKDEVQYNWLYDSQVNCRVEVDTDLTHAVATGAAGFLVDRIGQGDPIIVEAPKKINAMERMRLLMEKNGAAPGSTQ